MPKVEPRVVKTLWSPKQLIDSGNRRALYRHGKSRPVTSGGNEHLRTWGGGGRDFHVGISHAEAGSVLTGAASLHRAGDHYHGRLYRKTAVNCPQHVGLRAATGLPGAGQTSAIDVGKGGEKIERTNAVPRLESHQADVPKLVRLVGAKPTVTRIEGRCRNGSMVFEERVVVAHHVV